MSKILVGVIANDSARYSLFAACVTKLDLPEGANVEWLIGGDWCGARNTLAQMTIDEGYEYLWFMDDDHAFAPDLLKRLLAHDVALINPLCLARLAPFPLVTYSKKVDGGARYLPIPLAGMPAEGLVTLEAGGCAGMLIRRDVLEAIPAPWFEYTDRSEDIVFCEKAKAAGFTLYADLACRLGHITTTVVYPDVNEDGTWMTRLKIGGGLDLFVSPAADWVAEEEMDTPEGHSEDVLEETPVIAEQEAAPEVDTGDRKAERIEVWIDDELRWWWRAIGYDGRILEKDSGIREMQVIETASTRYPEVGIHLIQRETDDSRSLTRYGPPTRLWDREAR